MKQVRIVFPLMSNFEINKLSDKIKAEMNLSDEQINKLRQSMLFHSNNMHVDEALLPGLRKVFDFQTYDEWIIEDENKRRAANAWFNSLTEEQRGYIQYFNVGPQG